jgi:hypothetical protein
MSPTRRRRIAVATAALLAACTAAAQPSPASMIVDRDTSGATLEIDRTGKTALVTYRTPDGTVHHVLYWGAVNWGLKFARDYSGGWGSHHADWQTFADACRPYTGPALDLAVAACDAPDGSYWALQDWPRLWRNYGGRSAKTELHVSHWTGDIGTLDVRTDWGYHGRFQHLYGTFTFHGIPVFGVHHTLQGVPLDALGRNIYLDYHANGVWQRENSFLTHPVTGGFCYLFGHHAHRIGNGDAYRATVMGPGVTPIVRLQFAPPPPYDPATDAAANADEAQMLSVNGRPDPACVIN